MAEADPTSSEIYNDYNSRSMEMMMMLGFQSPNNNHLHQGSSFFDKPEDNIINPPYSKSRTHHHLHGYHNRSSSMAMDDPSSLRFVFPCEANEKPGQGLSLSLSSSNPSSIGLQYFELIRHEDVDVMRLFGSSSSSSRSENDHVLHLQQSSSEFQIFRSSRYLRPAKDFLNEFCSLRDEKSAGKMKAREDLISVKNQELYSLDPVELQRRKTKLLHMLEEADRKYKHYRSHMNAMVSSFEAVAGNGSSAVYSSMASKAISRHFRCLRDGIVSQIKAIESAMGDKDIGAASTVRISEGETSRKWRLPLMDQTQTHPWRRRRGLPEKPVSILRAWLFEHFLHPYPSDADKHMLALKTGLTRSQVSNWYINARVRLWKPMVEKMYLDELKEEEEEEANHSNNIIAVPSSNPNNLDHHHHYQSLPSRNDGCDQKPTVIKNGSNIPDKATNNEPHHSSYGDNMQQQLEFPRYRGGTNGGGGVSLTLGLHHHGVITSNGGGGGGGGHENLLLPLLSSSDQSSIFYNPRSSDGLYEDRHGLNFPYTLVDDGM